MVAFTTGRVVALPAWTSPATATPASTLTQECSCTHVDDSRSAAALLAANTRPPVAGRMKVWIASLTVSTAGTLSSTISARSSTVPMPIAHQLDIHSYPTGRVITSVNLSSSATTRKGMYALRPAAAASPIPVRAANMTRR